MKKVKGADPLNVYDEIHCLEDFGMIAGAYKVIYIDCVDSAGNPVDLSGTSSFGCRFLYYGTQTLAFDIDGESVADEVGRMRIELGSELTANFSDCCLEYIPYVEIEDQVIKYGKGRIVIEGDAV